MATSDKASHAAAVRGLFDRIAPRYDLINDLQSFGLHRAWKKQLLDRLPPQALPRDALMLDLCTGTGDIPASLLRSGFRVVGIDFSQAMLRKAQQRLGHPSGLCLVRANALEIPFRAETFDAVTIAYGLRNLSSLENGITEAWRVVRPGGRLLILDFSKPSNPLWRRLYYLYLRTVVPVFGLLFHGDAATYGYIFESLKGYPSAELLARELHELTGAEVVVETILRGAMAIHRLAKP